MSALPDAPPTAAGPWAPDQPPRVGVIGPVELSGRLARNLEVSVLRPHDDPDQVVREVDGLVVARSSFLPDAGPWGGALRPVWFDRGRRLASMLRVARTAGRRALLLDDLAHDQRDGWQQLLGSGIDEGVVLGPLAPEATGWNPGLHWDTDALALAAGRPGRAEEAVAAAGLAWDEAQRRAAAAGCAVVDGGSPWQRHLAAELDALGVRVASAGGHPVEAPRPVDPTTATARLLGLLDVEVGPAPSVVVVGGDGAQAAAAPAQAEPWSYTDLARRAPTHDRVLLLPPGDGQPAAAVVRACLSALDRLGRSCARAVALADVVAAPTSLLRAVHHLGRDAHATMLADALALERIA